MQGVWVMADYNNTLTWVFSEVRPVEPGPMRWVFKVSESKLKSTKFNAEPFRRAASPIIQKMVDEISDTNMREIVEALAAYQTRNSFSRTFTLQAAQELQQRLAELGCRGVRESVFLSNYAPNIFCQLPGTDTSLPMVYVGAHYDSRGPTRDSPTNRAPGADDNASGVAGVLEILRVITANGVTFRRTISFGLWAGEEQGLVGSDYEAYGLSISGVQIEAYVNLDMIGYYSRTYPDALWWVIRGVDTDLTDYGIELTYEYLGADTEIRTSTGCCSDQQSFLAYGYPAASVFESSTATANPNYHQASDLPATVDFVHAKRTTQAAAALLLTIAQPVE